MEQDPRVDAYIAKQAAFAQPILHRVRAAMALACPDAAETIKWSRPFWIEDGTILAMMSGFKEHVAFGAWRPIGSTAPGRAEGGWDRVTDAAVLPDTAVLAEQLSAAIARAAAVPVRPRDRKPVAVADTPDDLAAALAAAGATAPFDAFSPSARADYVAWITEAKRPETRAKRVAEAAAWIAEGKKRNWKYERC